ncbi:MAG: ABC transporter permease [Candidatus Poseidonia sp.]|nr:ABC transporter permease [Poseidonia sp.]
MTDEEHRPDAPVTGQARMEVAWGSSTGDETEAEATASLAKKSGEIFEQQYTSWNGTLNGRWMRNWAILRHHLLGIFKKGNRPWGMPTRIFLLIAFIIALSDAALVLVSSLIGSPEIHAIWGVSRDNLYGHILGYFPRNTLIFPVVAALLVGGVISEDRNHGTSALYFSRPISRVDYVGMKYISVAIIQAIIIIGSYMLYFFAEIAAHGRGWAWMLDVFPMFLAGGLCGVLLIVTYTSIGLSLSSVSKGRFFPGIGLLAILFGTKTMAIIVRNLFDRELLYLISPYDCVAHVGQILIGTEPTYTQYPWTFSLVSLIAINALALYVLSSRVSSMEVTRE